jgi:hypothetical protein
MDSGWFETLVRALATVQPRRGMLQIVSLLLAMWGGAADLLREDAAAKKKSNNKRQHHKKRKKRRRRRRRRNACKLFPSGAECTDGAQCCTGTCDENTAFPEFAAVCCQAEGASCVIGRNECCQDFACHCTTPDCVDFNGDTGVCGA